jgi:rRNA maturation RNase YbeY
MPPSVSFFYEDIIFKVPKPRKTVQWIKNVIQLENGTLDSINYIFCSDNYLYELNVNYLKHKTLTDIITFDLREHSIDINGEIYISIDRVRDNSIKLCTNFEEELSRVMIHGVLHLLGYSDKKREEKRVMREKEDLYLSLR